MDALKRLPDGRVMTTFRFRNKKQEYDVRYFLWPDEDLFRYAAKHGSAPSPKPKAD